MNGEINSASVSIPYLTNVPRGTILNKSDNMTWGREIRADKRLRDETVYVETDSRYVLTISGLTEVSSKNSLSLFTVSYFLRV